MVTERFDSFQVRYTKSVISLHAKSNLNKNKKTRPQYQQKLKSPLSDLTFKNCFLWNKSYLKCSHLEIVLGLQAFMLFNLTQACKYVPNSIYSYLSNKRTCPLILFKKKVHPTLWFSCNRLKIPPYPLVLRVGWNFYPTRLL
jgi:hypothetical protein